MFNKLGIFAVYTFFQFYKIKSVFNSVDNNNIIKYLNYMFREAAFESDRVNDTGLAVCYETKHSVEIRRDLASLDSLFVDVILVLKHFNLLMNND